MDKITPEKRSKNMSKIKNSNTKPEMLVRSLLHKMGYRFRIHRTDLPGSPDIVLPKYKTVIFVHGCFWHRHAGCKLTTTPKTRINFWSKKFSDNISRDKKNIQALDETGWNVVVIWECETKSVNRLKSLISKSLMI